MSDVLYKLVVEGGLKVLYKGNWVTEIVFDVDKITIGVLDPESNIYPDINLRQFRLEGEDPYISRRHACLYRDENKYYVEDICRNNSTSINTKANILNAQKYELTHGTRIFISESIVLKFVEVENISSESAKPVDTQPAEESAKPEGITATGIKTVSSDATKNPSEDVPEENEIADMVELPEESSKAIMTLEVETPKPVFFKPKNIFTNLIELAPSEWSKDKDNKPFILIGRHSTEDQIYPDVDLWRFFFNDGDEYIARRHARIFEENGQLYFQDISGKGSTWHTQRDDEHRLLHTEADDAKVLLVDGVKIFISDSVVLTAKRPTVD